MKIFRLAFDKFQYSARTYHKFLQVARTFADIDVPRDRSLEFEPKIVKNMKLFAVN